MLEKILPCYHFQSVISPICSILTAYPAKLLNSCIHIISNIFGSFQKVILMYVYSFAEFCGTMYLKSSHVYCRFQQKHCQRHNGPMLSSQTGFTLLVINLAIRACVRSNFGHQMATAAKRPKECRKAALCKTDFNRYLRNGCSNQKN